MVHTERLLRYNTGFVISYYVSQNKYNQFYRYLLGGHCCEINQMQSFKYTYIHYFGSVSATTNHCIMFGGDVLAFTRHPTLVKFRTRAIYKSLKRNELMIFYKIAICKCICKILS